MAKSKYVSVNFLYYQLWTVGQGEDGLYDLTDWLNMINNLDYAERVKTVNDITGRVEDIAGLAVDNEIYALNMMRMEEVSDTYVLTEDAEAKHVDLDENEYIGRNTVFLYDNRRKIVMVQCNRGGYGVSGIESYINSFYEDGPHCHFRPIENRFVLNNNPNRHYFKLDVRFANVREFRAHNSIEFERIINAFNQADCLTAHIEMGVGYNYNRENELSGEAIQNAIMDIMDENNRTCISSARVTLTDDQKSEIFNLFDNIMMDKISFTIPPRGELGFEVMANRMYEIYEDATRARIYNVLREG